MMYCIICGHRIHLSDDFVLEKNMFYHLDCFVKERENEEESFAYPIFFEHVPSTHKG